MTVCVDTALPFFSIIKTTMMVVPAGICCCSFKHCSINHAGWRRGYILVLLLWNLLIACSYSYVQYSSPISNRVTAFKLKTESSTLGPFIRRDSSRQSRNSASCMSMSRSKTGTFNDTSSSSSIVLRRGSDRNYNLLQTNHWWSEFAYGAQIVSDRYWEYVWRYVFVRSMKWVAILLLVNLFGHFLSPENNIIHLGVHNFISILSLAATSLGTMLQVPTNFLLRILSVIPSMITSAFSYLPANAALLLVAALTPIQNLLHSIWMSPFVQLTATLCGQPILDEFHYRYILDQMLGDKPIPRFPGGGLGWISHASRIAGRNSSPMVEFIPITGGGSPAKSLETESLSSSTGKDSDNKTSTAIVLANAPSRPMSVGPHFKLSVCTSGFLFALCHVGWLRSPNDYFVSGFISSAVAHLSLHSLVEAQPILSIVFLALALHQALVAWFVSFHVLSPLYEEHGLPAAMGGHLMWNIGWIFLPFQAMSGKKESSATPAMARDELEPAARNIHS